MCICPTGYSSYAFGTPLLGSIMNGLYLDGLSVYTSEDLKWDASEGRISNQHWNLTLVENVPFYFFKGLKERSESASQYTIGSHRSRITRRRGLGRRPSSDHRIVTSIGRFLCSNGCRWKDIHLCSTII